MRLVETVTAIKEEISDINNNMHEKVKKRSLELLEKHPEKKKLFTDFIAMQEAQIDVYTNKITCAAFVIETI